MQFGERHRDAVNGKSKIELTTYATRARRSGSVANALSMPAGVDPLVKKGSQLQAQRTLQVKMLNDGETDGAISRRVNWNRTYMEGGSADMPLAGVS